MLQRQQLKRLENCAQRGDSSLAMKSILVSIVAIVLLAGCGSEPNYSGIYTLTSGQVDLELELKPDGSFIGTNEKDEDNKATGSWKVEGDLLVCEGTLANNNSKQITVKFDKSTFKLISLAENGKEAPVDKMI